jgi:hypothetical protein
MCVHLPFDPFGVLAAVADVAGRAADASVAVLAVRAVVVDAVVVDAVVAALAPVRLSPRAKPPARAPTATAAPTSGRDMLIRILLCCCHPRSWGQEPRSGPDDPRDQ